MIVSKSRKFIYIIFISFITFVIYYPGLFGDYVFDDMPNIIENQKLHLKKINKNELLAAFWSGDAGPLGRPISMISFALNYYFTGFEPYYFKLTNLFIHLFNSFLIYCIALKIFQRIYNQKYISNKTIYLAGMVSLVWAIHPLNLTSILYVVQRMTSISTLFGLISILLYVRFRLLTEYNYTSLIFNTIAITVSLIFSTFSKESGILFIPLIYLIEICIFQAKNNDNEYLYLKGIKLIYFLWFGVLLGLLIYVYIGYTYILNAGITNRDFTIIERLMTEVRIIFYYLKMIFYPILSDLSLYHDNFTISKNLFTPISTLYSIIAFSFISIFCLILYKAYPLALFAWGWFLVSHLMESSFIPLELIHEHRNYFASIGFIIAGMYYVSQIQSLKNNLFINIIIVFFILNLGFTTWQRAIIWSNLVDHAAYEVNMKPDSDRANYQMARIYIKLMQQQPEEQGKYAQLALHYLHKAQQSYKPANGAWFGEIYLNSLLNKPTSIQTIQQLIENLKSKPFYNSNINFISNFMQCQVEGSCNIPHEKAIAIIVAGLDNPRISQNLKADIYKILAQYFVGVAADYAKGEEFVKEALNYHESIDSYLLLSQIYRLQGKIEEAKEQIKMARQIDQDNLWWKEIEIESKNLIL